MPGKPLPTQLNEDAVFHPLAADPPATGRSSGGWRGAWRGLLWCEWFAHSRMLLGFLGIWLAAVWSMPLYGHPGWILLVGLAYAALAGPAYGGGDTVEGCEEFSFSLPATRSERYLARLLVGGGALLILTVMDMVVLGLDLSQSLARLYLDTGLVKPVHAANPGMLYGLVLAFPFAVFAGSFVIAALARSRTLVLMAWFWGGLGALLVLFAGIEYEFFVWGKVNGVFTCPVLLVGGAAVLVAGHYLYRRKEVGPMSQPIHVPGHWWAWLVFFLVSMGLAFALLLAMARHFPQLPAVFR